MYPFSDKERVGLKHSQICKLANSMAAGFGDIGVSNQAHKPPRKKSMDIPWKEGVDKDELIEITYYSEDDEIRNPWKAQIRNIIEALIEKNGTPPSVNTVMSEIEKQVEEDPVHFEKQDAKGTSPLALEEAMRRGQRDRLTEYVIHGEAKTIRTWKDNIARELKRFYNN